MEVKKQRRVMADYWKTMCKQWDNHTKNPSAPVSISSKNNKPHTKFPKGPKLPQTLLVCKASKMKETHRGGDSNAT